MPDGTWMQLWTLVRLRRMLRRCPACAGEAPPVYDPPARQREAPLVVIDDDGIERPVMQPMTRIGRVDVGVDFKSKASGE